MYVHMNSFLYKVASRRVASRIDKDIRRFDLLVPVLQLVIPNFCSQSAQNLAHQRGNGVSCNVNHGNSELTKPENYA